MPQCNLGAAGFSFGPFASGIDYLYKVSASVNKAAYRLYSLYSLLQDFISREGIGLAME
jgi:hypothetical protein